MYLIYVHSVFIFSSHASIKYTIYDHIVPMFRCLHFSCARSHSNCSSFSNQHLVVRPFYLFVFNSPFHIVRLFGIENQ